MTKFIFPGWAGPGRLLGMTHTLGIDRQDLPINSWKIAADRSATLQ